MYLRITLHDVDNFFYTYRYTLLVGRPPFETMSLKETYTRIKTNQYVIPSRISTPAAKLIQKFLSNNPQNRPCLHTVCETDEFFVKGFVPSSLPSSCCMVPPRFTALHRSSSNSEQNGATQPTSNKINYVFTKLQLKDEKTNDRTEWIEKETKSSSTSPTQGKLYIESWQTNRWFGNSAKVIVVCSYLCSIMVA